MNAINVGNRERCSKQFCTEYVNEAITGSLEIRYCNVLINMVS